MHTLAAQSKAKAKAKAKAGLGLHNYVDIFLMHYNCSISTTDLYIVVSCINYIKLYLS